MQSWLKQSNQNICGKSEQTTNSTHLRCPLWVPVLLNHLTETGSKRGTTHLPHVWSQWFHLALWSSIKKPLWSPGGPIPENKNPPAAVVKPRCSRCTIRYPLICSDWLDVDVNQRCISVMVSLLIASHFCDCIYFHSRFLSTNVVRKAYGFGFLMHALLSAQRDAAQQDLTFKVVLKWRCLSLVLVLLFCQGLTCFIPTTYKYCRS